MTGQEIINASGERFIQLVNPNEQLHDVQGGWSAPDIIIPAIGSVSLKILNYVCDSDSDPAVAIEQGKLIQAPAGKLFESGLSPLEIEVVGITPKESGLICSIVLPQENIVLDSVFEFADDEYVKDPKRRYFAFTDLWTVNGNGGLFFFYVPKDVQFLSMLKFKFRTPAFTSQR